MKQVHNEMLEEISAGGSFGRDTEGYNQLVEVAQQGAKAGDESPTAATAQRETGKAPELVGDIPQLIAIADFEPPATHQTQMLSLVVGDVIDVIGQDGKGWWYGKKQNGTDGWFPPSYVQTKAAHFSSAGK